MAKEKTADFMQVRQHYPPLRELNLMDDFLFDVATADLQNCKDILELALNLQIKELRWKENQKVLHNLPGKRGIRMDFYAEDYTGNIFEVEMQKRNEGNIPKRTRFYQALVDSPLLDSGEKGFDTLRPVYIVVICAFDLFGEGLYRYTFDNRCQERLHLLLGDECHKIILNTKGLNDAEVEPELVKFLHYVENSREAVLHETEDERLKRLHEKISTIKASAELEVTYMKMEERDRLIKEEGWKLGKNEGRNEGRSEGRSEGRNEGRSEGLKEGREAERIENAKALLKMGVDVTLVQKALNLTEEEVQVLGIY